MTDSLRKSLDLLGISPRDLRVYKALLEGSEKSIRSIATSSGVNRGSVYESIKSLSNLGLVTHVTKGQRKFYSAAPPATLNDLFESTKNVLSSSETAISALVHDLDSLTPKEELENLTRFYEGYDGIALVLKDVLKTVAKIEPKEYYVYSSKALRGHLYVDFPHFKQRRVKLGIKVKVIAVGSGGDELELAERKWLNSKTKNLASYTIIYGNKVATISLSETQLPYAVVVEDEGVSTMQKLVFETLWAQIK